MSITKNKIIILITAVAVASFSIYYATAGIFKINTQVVNDLTSGLVGYWTFDGEDTDWSTNTTNDLSGNGSTGIITNMSTSTDAMPGIIGQALDFDGSDDTVDTGDPAVFNSLSAITISTWVYPKDDSTRQGISVKRGVGGNGWRLVYDGSALSCDDDLISWTNADFNVCSNSTVSVNEWTHLAVTADASASQVYLNGQLDNTGTGGSFGDSSGTNHIIAQTFGNTFKGLIDELRIYNRALSASEITELYNQGAKRLAVANKNQKTDIVPDGLVGYWAFEGEDMDWNSNTISDLSGNNYTGTMYDRSTSTTPDEGIIGQALSFNGQGYIDMGDIMDFEISDPFSFSFWVKFDNFIGHIMSKWYTGCSSGWYVSSDTGKVALAMNGNNCGWIGVYEQATPSLDTWYHYAITYDGSQDANGVKIYRDTSEGQTININESIDTVLNDFPFRLGARASGSLNFNGGDLDEVRIYDRVLSSSEVKELYDQGAEKLLKVNAPQTDLIPNGLVGYWTFDGQDTDWSSNTVNDLSGSGNTGTIVNMSTTTSPTEGIVGQALDFDGVDDHVDLGDVLEFEVTDPFSVCSWFLNKVKIAKGYAGDVGHHGYALLTDAGGTVYWGFKYDGDWIKRAVSSFTPSPWQGVWRHVCGTYDGSESANGLNLYLDGIQDSPNRTDLSVTTILSDYSLYIGRQENGSYTDGLMDEVRIYNRELSADEVKELYMAGAGR